MTFIIMLAVDWTMVLRVSEAEEEIGLDFSLHGEVMEPEYHEIEVKKAIEKSEGEGNDVLVAAIKSKLENPSSNIGDFGSSHGGFGSSHGKPRKLNGNNEGSSYTAAGIELASVSESASVDLA